MQGKNNPIVSIIVPVYNTKEYLQRCIDSILGQTYTNFELLLIDDGSTDCSSLICDEYAKKDSRIKVFHKENGGQGSARNLGLEVCEGDYICFIDSDDAINEEYLALMLEKCINTSSKVAVCNVKKSEENIEDYNIFVKNVLMDNIGGQLWKFIFHKSIWEGIKIPENRYAEDAMVLPKVLVRADKVEVIFRDLYIYNITNPLSSSNSKEKLLKNTVDRALMFIERYDWVMDNGYPETREVILQKGTEFSIGALGCYKKYAYDKQDIQKLCNFLNENAKEIYSLSSLSLGRKIAVKMICHSPNLYYRVRSLWKQN